MMPTISKNKTKTATTTTSKISYLIPRKVCGFRRNVWNGSPTINGPIE